MHVGVVCIKKVPTFAPVIGRALPLETTRSDDSLAQLVEQQTLNLWVQGSIPWRVTENRRIGDLK